jgi:hypothetical protein
MNYIDAFLDFEDRHDLFEKKIQGVRFWHYIRFELFFDVIKKHETISSSYASSDFSIDYVGYLLKKIRLLPAIIVKNPYTHLRKRDVLVFNHPRRIKNGDYYDCVYTDEILSQADFSFYVFEDPYMEDHYRGVRTRNLRYTDLFRIIRTMKRKLYLFFGRYEFIEAEKDLIRELAADLNEIIGLNISCDRLAWRIRTVVLNHKISQIFYDKLLRKIDPALIVEVVSYNHDRMILNEAARKRNIPVVELQHGAMGKYHIAYNYSRKREIGSFPDYVFTYGDFWKIHTRLPIDEDKVKVVGSVYFDQKLRSKPSNVPEKDKRQILFVSQLTIGEQLSIFAVELSKIIDKTVYQIIYKLHPTEYSDWRNQYPWLKSDAVTVIDNNDHDIYYYFGNAFCQVGCYSTAIFEGLGFGLKTFILPFYGYQYMEELYNNEYAKLVTTPDDIIEDIDKYDHPSTRLAIDLWRPDALRNIHNEITALLRSQGKKDEYVERTENQ